ncbi:MAG: hypothetical protein ACOYWZ_15035 [Bacillota bacterium]
MSSSNVLCEQFARLRWILPTYSINNICKMLNVSSSFYSTNAEQINARALELAQLETQDIFKSNDNAHIKALHTLQNRCFLRAVEFQADVLDGKYDNVPKEPYRRRKEASLEIIGANTDKNSNTLVSITNANNQQVSLNQNELNIIGNAMEKTLTIHNRLKKELLIPDGVST